jgi:2-polyprenyl-6-methoxyphenol hydroxylase-like FAD-dependent oxidoreductase
MTEPSWPHAVVVGGGMAGLVTARVLADHFRRVTVLERDAIDADTDYRSGVPQCRHPHVLLARGAQILEQLFPGLRADLAELGAPIYDIGHGMRIRFPSGPAKTDPLGLPVQTFTRVALERAVRRRVLDHPGITVRGGFRVDNLCFDRENSRVTGVRGAETVYGDLIVIAGGRTLKLADWLADAGFPAPPEMVIPGGLSYTSRLFDRTPEFDPDWQANYEIPYAPRVRRGGLVVAVESGRWLITMFGANGEATPTDEAGFLHYAKTLHTPAIADSIADVSPVGSLYRMVGLGNRWTRFDRMARWPDRLACVGDTVCAPNPLYGQGMTMAAVQALILGRVLDRQRDLTGVARSFQRRAAKAMNLPWLQASSADLAWNPDKAPLSARIARWYFDGLIDLIPHDTDAYRRFQLAAQMLRGPAVLAHPRVLARIVTRKLVTGRRG